ncbi:esterase-like activity of phytase family protein [Streptomyces sp. CNQ-509]|uniref:effector-associated constant component EACC1 n=1 Tax=Streptomyces sp. CNQ-509 TaxID=444103 RepID=UPI000699FB8F|nr:esterase-like activity of phytase family protein [Streptomyces sp. CNQ-509]
MHIKITAQGGPEGEEELRSLRRHLEDDPAIPLTPSMGLTLEAIEFVTGSSFDLANLVLALSAWRASRPVSSTLEVRRDEHTVRLSPQALANPQTTDAALRPRLPLPHLSYAVLIGVADHVPESGLRPLPAVDRGCLELRDVLGDSRIWGLPTDRCRIVRPQTREQLLDPVAHAARQASDCLVVYWAGHGLTHDGALHLALPGSREADVPGTAVPFTDLLRRLGAAPDPPSRTIVVLDCCQGSVAFDAVRREVEAAELRDICVLAASPPGGDAVGTTASGLTAFTQALVETVRAGLGNRQDFLTPNDIADELRRTVPGQGGPAPHTLDPHTVGSRPFVRNLRAKPATAHLSWPRRHSRALTAAAVTLAVITGVGVWKGSAGTGTTGPCSEKVGLLGYSDALDTVADSTPVQGLSALAVTGDRSILALGDNRPPRLHSLTLDDARLVPAVGDPTILHPRDDSLAAADIDGEGMAVDGENVLISSEAGPSIRSYRLSDGMQNDEIELPEVLRESSPARRLESLSLSEDRTQLYAGMEGPLHVDGESAGQNHVRILRYTRSPGGEFGEKPQQYAYKTEYGLFLTELIALGGDRLLALERGYMPEGNSVHLYLLSLAKTPDISGRKSISGITDDSWVEKDLLANLVHCPTAGAPRKQAQLNPLLDNIEGMALGEHLPDGRRALYLVSDNNANTKYQTTRFYKMSVDLS